MRDSSSEQHHLRQDIHHDDRRHDDDVASVVRHEEELFVDTRPVETGRVRVSKRVVTEERTITVRREELVVEELPAGGDDVRDDHAVAGNPAKEAALDAARAHRPTAQPGRTEGDRAVAEIVLHEERVVTQVVPVERVQVFVDRVTREQTVSDDLRKEVVTIEEDGPRHDRGVPDYAEARHRRD